MLNSSFRALLAATELVPGYKSAIKLYSRTIQCQCHACNFRIGVAYEHAVEFTFLNTSMLFDIFAMKVLFYYALQRPPSKGNRCLTDLKVCLLAEIRIPP